MMSGILRINVPLRQNAENLSGTCWVKWLFAISAPKNDTDVTLTANTANTVQKCSCLANKNQNRIQQIQLEHFLVSILFGHGHQQLSQLIEPLKRSLFSKRCKTTSTYSVILRSPAAAAGRIHLLSQLLSQSKRSSNRHDASIPWQLTFGSWNNSSIWRLHLYWIRNLRKLRCTTNSSVVIW